MDSAGAGSTPRVVPWTSWDEWITVRNGLCTSTPGVLPPSPEATGDAVRLVRVWRTRGSVPLCVDASACLAELLLLRSMGTRSGGGGGSAGMHHFSRGAATLSSASGASVPGNSHVARRAADGAERAGVSESVFTLAVSMAVTRFVNGACDSFQRGAFARSVASVARSLGLPPIAVDIRHSATHGAMPGARLARWAALEVMAWAEARYWGPQGGAVADWVDGGSSVAPPHEHEKKREGKFAKVGNVEKQGKGASKAPKTKEDRVAAFSGWGADRDDFDDLSSDEDTGDDDDGDEDDGDGDDGDEVDDGNARRGLRLGRMGKGVPERSAIGPVAGGGADDAGFVECLDNSRKAPQTRGAEGRGAGARTLRSVALRAPGIAGGAPRGRVIGTDAGLTVVSTSGSFIGAIVGGDFRDLMGSDEMDTVLGNAPAPVIVGFDPSDDEPLPAPWKSSDAKGMSLRVRPREDLSDANAQQHQSKRAKKCASAPTIALL